ncbi:MAG: hypothetical protein R6U19_03415 [Bacteroidales bacterium]
MLKVILLAIILVGLAVAGIAVKMFLKKGYAFEKKCSTKDPVTGKHISCGCNDDNCKNEKPAEKQ